MIRLIAATIIAATPATAAPLQGMRSGGGSIAKFATEIAAHSGSPVELRGQCASACIMWLEKGCVVTSGAGQTWLSFHGPSWGGEPMAEADFGAWSRFIAAHYPPAMADWYMQTGRHGMHHKSAAWAVRMGAEECKQ